MELAPHCTLSSYISHVPLFSNSHCNCTPQASYAMHLTVQSRPVIWHTLSKAYRLYTLFIYPSMATTVPLERYAKTHSSLHQYVALLLSMATSFLKLEKREAICQYGGLWEEYGQHLYPAIFPVSLSEAVTIGHLATARLNHDQPVSVWCYHRRHGLVQIVGF